MAAAQKLMAQQMISITVKNLDVLVNLLLTDMEKQNIEKPSGGFTSEELKNYFIEYKIFPPETYFGLKLFSTDKPGVSLSYMWPATPIQDVVGILKRRFSDEDTVYIDIFLNDQRTPASIQVALANADIRCYEHKHSF
jgi:hypothetical protein